LASVFSQRIFGRSESRKKLGFFSEYLPIRAFEKNLFVELFCAIEASIIQRLTWIEIHLFLEFHSVFLKLRILLFENFCFHYSKPKRSLMALKTLQYSAKIRLLVKIENHSESDRNGWNLIQTRKATFWNEVATRLAFDTLFDGAARYFIPQLFETFSYHLQILKNKFFKAKIQRIWIPWNAQTVLDFSKNVHFEKKLLDRKKKFVRFSRSSQKNFFQVEKFVYLEFIQERTKYVIYYFFNFVMKWKSPVFFCRFFWSSKKKWKLKFQLIFINIFLDWSNPQNEKHEKLFFKNKKCKSNKNF